MIFNTIVGNGGGRDSNYTMTDAFAGFLYAPNAPYIASSYFPSNGANPYAPWLIEASFPMASYVGANAFTGCTKLVKIDLPSVTRIGSSAFVSLSNNLQVCNINSNCEYFYDYAFSNCSKLTGSLTLYSAKLISSYAFASCGFQEVDIAGSSVIIGNYAFQSCQNLKTIKLENISSLNQYAFAGCNSVETVSISFAPSTILGWADNVIACAMPNGNTVTINNFNGFVSNSGHFFQSGKTINLNRFEVNGESFGLYSTAFIVYPNSWWTYLSIQTAVINGVNYLSEAFTYLKISEIILSGPLSSIGYGTFASCRYLASLNLTKLSSVPSLYDVGVFNSTPISSNTTDIGHYGSIYVPSSLYNSFKTATNWSAYSSRMVSV